MSLADRMNRKRWSVCQLNAARARPSFRDQVVMRMIEMGLGETITPRIEEIIQLNYRHNSDVRGTCDVIAREMGWRN